MIQPAEIGRMGYPDLPGRNRVTVASGLASDVQPGPGTVPRSRIVGDAGERPAHLDRDGPLALPMRAPRSMRSPRVRLCFETQTERNTPLQFRA